MYTVCIGVFSYSDVQSMLSEVTKMHDLAHPNVMTLLGVCVHADQGPSIVMPYMVNGSLLDYLKKERERLDVDNNAELETVRIYNYSSVIIS